MKKLMVMIVALLGVAAACADDRPIAVEKLPQAARQFIADHFSAEKVAFAKVDGGVTGPEYEVVFNSGTKIEFLKNGEWKDVDCRYSAVPSAIVPRQIVAYVGNNYPDAKIVQIDRDRRGWEAKLSNGLELSFDREFRLVDIDD
ncbi:MAG: PepSY-like domain-containing protein [Alistipes sp.]|nr:PepSY-like domain-containing protein [Alistipes sp.]